MAIAFMHAWDIGLRLLLAASPMINFFTSSSSSSSTATPDEEAEAHFGKQFSTMTHAQQLLFVADS